MQQAPIELVKVCEQLAAAAQLAFRSDPSFNKQAILTEVRQDLDMI